MIIISFLHNKSRYVDQSHRGRRIIPTGRADRKQHGAFQGSRCPLENKRQRARTFIFNNLSSKSAQSTKQHGLRSWTCVRSLTTTSPRLPRSSTTTWTRPSTWRSWLRLWKTRPQNRLTTSTEPHSIWRSGTSKDALLQFWPARCTSSRPLKSTTRRGENWVRLFVINLDITTTLTADQSRKLKETYPFMNWDYSLLDHEIPC